jgi:hypothetical protein
MKPPTPFTMRRNADQVRINDDSFHDARFHEIAVRQKWALMPVGSFRTKLQVFLSPKSFQRPGRACNGQGKPLAMRQSDG